MERKFYLEDIPLEDAWAAFREALTVAGLWRPLDAETVPLSGAYGRVTAEAVWARLSSPHYHASAMDGYALRAEDTVGATEVAPVRFVLLSAEERGSEGAGEKESLINDSFSPAIPVNTGHPLPPWANAVVMIEHVQPVTLDDGRAGIELRAALPPWHHVRSMGEDMVATELVLPANHRLRPVDLGALAGAGHATVRVIRRPRVAIIPTGSELVPVDAGEPPPGQIIEYNSLVLAAQVEEWGGAPTRWPIVADNFDAICAAVAAAAADHDLVLLNAGSSAGSEDYTAHVVQSLGRLLVHGVAVRPGHPVILGVTSDERRVTNEEVRSDERRVTNEENFELITRHSSLVTPIIGVPGYPVSACLLYTSPSPRD